MKNWDDIRIFLAVALEGSIRRAAVKLGINHSTVSRRISAFEDELNVRFFERLTTGYLLTPAGEELMNIAKQMEEAVALADRNILGRDSQMCGTLKVSLPGVLGNAMLIKEYAKFCELYPQVELNLNHTYETADLSKREADVAIRMTRTPPEELFGRKVVAANIATYISKDYWRRINDKDDPSTARWLVWKNLDVQAEIIKSSMFPKAPQLNLTNDPEAMTVALKAGIGIAVVTCMLGDAEPDLMRLPPGNVSSHLDIWVLTHKDLRRTLRVKTFMDFTVNALIKNQNLIQGMLGPKDR